MTNLDYQRSIWIYPNELGKDKTIDHNNKKIKFKVPQKIDDKVILRFRELGKTEGKETGDLLIYLWLIAPEDTISTKKSNFQENKSIGYAKKSYSFSGVNEFLGFLLIIVGILLVIGNLSGLFPTFPLAGFITMSIGFFLVHG